MSLNCLACGKILDGQRRKYCSQKCIANHRPVVCKNCGKKYFAHAMSRYCSSECKKENFNEIKNVNLWGNDLSDLNMIRQLQNIEVVSLSVN